MLGVSLGRPAQYLLPRERAVYGLRLSRKGGTWQGSQEGHNFEWDGNSTMMTVARTETSPLPVSAGNDTVGVQGWSHQRSISP